MCGAVYRDGAVLGDGDAHAGLDLLEELVPQRVDDGHSGVLTLQPHVGQNDAGACQRVDGLRKEHTGGLSAHGAGAVEHQAARRRTDGLGQAQRLARHFAAEQIGIVLVAAGGLFVAELQRLLEGGQRVEAAVGDKGFGRQRAGSHNASFESHHHTSPFVSRARISSSV